MRKDLFHYERTCDERNSLFEETVEALIFVKMNVDWSCEEAYKKFINNKELLVVAILGQKYKNV